MSDVRIRVVATDLETGETAEKIIGPGNYVIIASNPCHVANEQNYANGTTVLTLRGRSREFMGTVYVEPTKPDGASS